ncbi:tRNA (adenosine(37)-N6)-threonylcarbamoyltransferase complex dimerization subunit type 1 TsaB [Oscillospiraceae bacterium 50-60]
MKILALETSAKAVSAAVTEGGRVLAAGFQDTGLTHSRTLMPIVEHILKNADLTMADMDAVAVAVGPGSFTGIRIGVSAAKGLAFAADKPAVGVSTLAAMARNAAFVDGLVVCAMDARRNQIYNALFAARDGRLTRLTPDRAIGLEDLAEELRQDSRPKIIVGDGGKLCADALAAAGIACRLAPPHLVMQSAVTVALEAEEAAGHGGLVSAQELLPVYLRPPQAERLRRERESGGKSAP